MTQIPLEPHLFWPLLAIGGFAFALLPLFLTSPLADSLSTLFTSRWWRDNYVRFILCSVLVLLILSVCFYLFEITLGVRVLVDLLGEELAAPSSDGKPEKLRNLSYAIGALIAVLAGSATIFFSSLRVWINERNTTATEQGLVTERINSAVEGLGAEKDIGQGSQPNLEVRIGAILSLERIAQQNLDFHIQIVEILCAYVRQMAGVSRQDLLAEPRIDIQLVLTVLGRRRNEQREIERFSKSIAQPLGFRLDLSKSHLEGADLRGGDFSYTDFSGSKLIRARCSGSNFSGTVFDGSEFSGSRFNDCILDGALLIKPELKGTEFTQTTAKGTLFLEPVIDHSTQLGFQTTLGAAVYIGQNGPFTRDYSSFSGAFVGNWEKTKWGQPGSNTFHAAGQPSIPNFIDAWEEWLQSNALKFSHGTAEEFKRRVYT